MTVEDSSELDAIPLAYWHECLADAPRLLELPTDAPRAAKRRYQHAASPRVPLVSRPPIGSWLSPDDLGVFSAVLTAFCVVLHRYTGQHDLLVGSTTVPVVPDGSGASAGQRPLLVLRTECLGDPSFRHLHERVRGVVRAAGRHPVSFTRLLDRLDVESDPNHHPLVQVGFELGGRPPRDRTEDGQHGSDRWPMDVTLVVEPMADALETRIDYDASLFRADTIGRLAGHVRSVLQAAITDPESPISTLPLLTAAERTQLLVDWNHTAVDFPHDRCIHELFEQRTRTAPDAVAVASDSGVLSYAELNRQANQLAHHLRSLGTGPDQLVGLCVERSLDMAVGLLGILKSGAAYLPLDPSHPSERLAVMLDDAGASVLVTHKSLAALVPGFGGRLVRLDADAQTLAEASSENPVALARPDNLCLAIYTSGSSGRPKGVLLEHRGRVNNFTDFNRRFAVGPGDRLLAVAALGFDMSSYDVLGILAAGATVVLPRAADERDPAHWADLMTRDHITIWHSPPVMLDMLVERVRERPALRPRDLRLALLGGDWIPVELPARLRALVPDVEVISLGGATEVSMDSTIYRIGETDPSWTSIPYGRPMANQVAHVLDSTLEPVPVGVPGELCLGGIGVARGYLDSPDLTAEKFVPHPFPRVPGERLYRTGDLARYLPDGNLELLGRLDHQVKIRGNRVELGDVAAALKEHPLVSQVVVVATDGAGGARHLIAYVVPELEVSVARGDSLADLRVEHVDRWRKVYDETYRREPEQSDPTLNLIGWNSSYTGLPIPDEEMQEWVDTTVARILDWRPSEVLEIGCGTGLLLFRIAPRCRTYWGTDLSEVALEGIRRQLGSHRPPLSHVSLFRRQATDFRGLESSRFDTVILNSVTQLFPSVDYLLDVLEGAARLVAPGGRIFVGDVRSLPHLEMFHTSVRVFQSPGSLSIQHLRSDISRSVTQESQLVIDPALFRALPERIPQIGAVRIALRHGRYHNELTRFRFDAVLTIGTRPEPDDAPHVCDWHADRISLARLRQQLAVERNRSLLVTNVPNARLARDVSIQALLHDPDGSGTVADLRERVRRTLSSDDMVDPEELRTLAQELGFDLQIDWARTGTLGACDVTFRSHAAARNPGPAAASPAEPSRRKPWSAYANRPTLARAAEMLPPKLSSFLRDRLPEYMVPSMFVVLEALPLSANGKVDRRALRPPDPARPHLAEPYVPPSDPVEELVARTWGELLGFERVGRNDRFVDLGGHSLLAIQIAARLQDFFPIDLPLRAFLSSPTPATLASHIRDCGQSAGIDILGLAVLRLRD